MRLRSFLTIAVCPGSLLFATTGAFGAGPTPRECAIASDTAAKLAERHELRAERVQLLICAADACPADVRADCAQQMEAVNRAMPSIIFEVKDGAGKDLNNVKVTMDGVVLTNQLGGTAINVDPGEHRFLFEVRGQDPVEKVFVIRETQQNRSELIRIGPVPTVSPVKPPMVPAPEAAPVASESPRDSGGTLRTLGYVVGGVGLAGVGVGAIFALKMNSEISERDDMNRCSDTSSCSDEKAREIARLTSDARRDATVATIGFVAGGVAVAGGIVLVLVGSANDTKSKIAFNMQPWLGTNSGGMTMGGAW